MSPNCKCISLICVALSMLTAGCSHTYRVGDYTLLSTKNVNLDSGNRAKSSGELVHRTRHVFPRQIPCHL